MGVHTQLQHPRGFTGPRLASSPLHPKGGHPSVVHVVLGTGVLRLWTKLQECQGAGLWHESFLCFFLFFFFFLSLCSSRAPDSTACVGMWLSKLKWKWLPC